MAATLGEKTGDNKENREKKSLHGKTFVIQQSYYTTLSDNDHYNSVYHLVVSIFIISLLNTVILDLLIFGQVYMGVRTLKIVFGKFHIALAVWVLMQSTVLGIRYGLLIWMGIFRSLKSHTYLRRIWNFLSLMAFCALQFHLIFMGSRSCMVYDLPLATSISLIMETLRVTMKTHAFIRTTVPGILANDSFQLPPLKSYVYFLFAPTFIYREAYPRTKAIVWTCVIKNIIELISGVFFMAILSEKNILPVIENFGLKPSTLVEIISGYFSLIMPFTLILLCSHRIILHTWPNITAEILRFGDRMYYSDWWTSKNYRHYFSTWNLLVHEWINEYVYKELQHYIFKSSFICPVLVVFSLSAFMHELMCIVTLKMIYPVLFFMFGGLGVLCFFCQRNWSKGTGNLFFILTLSTGITLMCYMYALEYYARKNCTNLHQMSNNEKLLHYPVSWNIIGKIIE